MCSPEEETRLDNGDILNHEGRPCKTGEYQPEDRASNAQQRPVLPALQSAISSGAVNEFLLTSGMAPAHAFRFELRAIEDVMWPRL